MEWTREEIREKRRRNNEREGESTKEIYAEFSR